MNAGDRRTLLSPSSYIARYLGPPRSARYRPALRKPGTASKRPMCSSSYQRLNSSSCAGSMSVQAINRPVPRVFGIVVPPVSRQANRPHTTNIANDGKLPGRYNPGECIDAETRGVEGHPDPAHVSTPYVGRSNLSIRLGNRRFTRLTNALSKKAANHVTRVGKPDTFAPSVLDTNGKLSCFNVIGRWHGICT